MGGFLGSLIIITFIISIPLKVAAGILSIENRNMLRCMSASIVAILLSNLVALPITNEILAAIISTLVIIACYSQIFHIKFMKSFILAMLSTGLMLGFAIAIS